MDLTVTAAQHTSGSSIFAGQNFSCVNFKYFAGISRLPVLPCEPREIMISDVRGLLDSMAPSLVVFISALVIGLLPTRLAHESSASNCSFLPPHSLTISAGTPSSLTESDFLGALGELRDAWSATIRERGKELLIQSRWQDERVNAYATLDDLDNPVIVAPGGIARHPLMTRDGLVAIFCHELGHFLGGAPKARRGTSDRLSWSSAEGAADYFASAKCMRKIFNEDAARIQEASRVAALIFAAIKGYSHAPTLDSQDPTEAPVTLDGHPSPQCRLDTFLAGLRCEVQASVPMDDHDPAAGACLQGPGARPRCWYRP